MSWRPKGWQCPWRAGYTENLAVDVRGIYEAGADKAIEEVIKLLHQEQANYHNTHYGISCQRIADILEEKDA